MSESFGDEGGAFDIDPDDVRDAGPSQARRPQSTPRRPIRFVTLDELAATKPPPWLIKGVIRRGELVVLVGEPAGGKTFVTIDMLMSIASGRSWWQYAVTPGPAVYLAGEGAFGLTRRCQAWGAEHGFEYDAARANLRILPFAVEFMNEGEFQRLLEALREMEPKPVAIAIDTLARHFVGGDENSAQDMNLFVSRCDRIRDVTGAAVIVVHHTRKDSKIERGSSALRGAADAMLNVEKKGWDVNVEGEKCKDGELLKKLRLVLFPRNLGTDEDGDTITSLVLLRPEEEEGGQRFTLEPDPDVVIRQTLAEVFGGIASGNQLQQASDIKRTQFYDLLKVELREGRIERVDSKRVTRYRLTPKAKEFVAPPPPPPASPSPSSGESANSQSGLGRGVPKSECESASPPPLKGADANSNSDSTKPASSPQQKKGAKNRPGGAGKADRALRARGGKRAKASPATSNSQQAADSLPDSLDAAGGGRDA